MNDLVESVYAVEPPEAVASPVRLGRLVSVSGGRAIAVLDRDASVQVANLVKIERAGATVMGVVEGVTIPLLRRSDEDQEARLAEIAVVGELLPDGRGGRGTFRRGVSRMPCLDDVVLATDSFDTKAIYARDHRQSIVIGTAHQDPNVLAHVSVDDLLGRHFAIVGATGTGKSCALALLLQGITRANQNGHILLLDAHGEYATAFGDKVDHLTVDRLQLPYWILEFEELVEILFGSEKNNYTVEVGILRQLVLKARLAYSAGRRQASSVTVDTPIPYSLAELNNQLEYEIGRLDKQTALPPLLRLKNALAIVQEDPRYGFMFPNGIFLLDNLAQILGQLFRIPTEGKPICRLDLSSVSSEILNVVVSVVARLAFNVAMAVGQRTPLLLICEEAHHYAPRDSHLGFEPAKRSLSRIAKEGRKYGISLGLLSQRPAEVAVSILSQCSTVFAMRMISTTDQEVIQGALSDASASLVASLPLLSNGEAVVVGEGVAVPMRVRLAKLPESSRPRSQSASFSTLWQQDQDEEYLLQGVVETWRGAR